MVFHDADCTQEIRNYRSIFASQHLPVLLQTRVDCHGCDLQATHNSFIWVPNAVGAVLALLQLSLCLAFQRKARMDPEDGTKREPLLSQAEEEREGGTRAGLLNQRRGSSAGEDV